ncbi:unnamed protein product [Nezara viridula]|uniref:Uncharacterized protein n=1 Tax=Nezara viridula TaxID=85310 RepID=A0A9P0HT94_NEZVI|nr:unnamed protein product [Nezara viridula]
MEFGTVRLPGPFCYSPFPRLLEKLPYKRAPCIPTQWGPRLPIAAGLTRAHLARSIYRCRCIGRRPSIMTVTATLGTASVFSVDFALCSQAGAWGGGVSPPSRISV